MEYRKMNRCWLSSLIVCCILKEHESVLGVGVSIRKFNRGRIRLIFFKMPIFTSLLTSTSCFTRYRRESHTVHTRSSHGL